MSEDESRPGPTGEKERRDKRLAERLRANLQKRKGQMRARRAGAADERAEGLPDGREPAPKD